MSKTINVSDNFRERVVKLKCGHTFTIDFYSNTIIRQVIMCENTYCMECDSIYESEYSDIIKKLYELINEEKNTFKEILIEKNLNELEKNTLKKFRKEFYINTIKNKNKEDNIYRQFVLYIFDIMFDTVYVI